MSYSLGDEFRDSKRRRARTDFVRAAHKRRFAREFGSRIFGTELGDPVAGPIGQEDEDFF